MIELLGSIEDGWDDADDDGIISTDDFPCEPGSPEAQQMFAGIKEHAIQEGEYGGRSLAFGEGGRSRLFFDQLVFAQGVEPDVAKAIIGKNYQIQLAKRGM